MKYLTDSSKKLKKNVFIKKVQYFYYKIIVFKQK